MSLPVKKKQRAAPRLKRHCSGKGKHKGCGKLFTPKSRWNWLCEDCTEEVLEIRRGEKRL